KPGDYQFIEMAAPFGYDLDPTPINFTIEKAKTVDDVKQIEVTAKNELSTGSVELTKVDTDNKNVPIKDPAVFELQDENGKTLQENLTTNEEGTLVVDDLKPGNYQFVETKAPFGYDLDPTPVTFTIDKGQTEITKVIAGNELTTGSVELRSEERRVGKECSDGRESY